MHPTLVLDGATLHTVAGPVIPLGRLVVTNGRIAAVGPASSIKVPKGAHLVDVTGLHLTPGMVDAHMHAGLHQSGVSGPESEHYNEMSHPVTPHLRAEDGINPLDSAFQDALAAGVTLVCVLPGSANVVGGLAVNLRTYGARLQDMMYAERPGMKVAFGENPCRIYRDQKKAPMTRMAVPAILRDTLAKARASMEKKPAKGDAPDLGLQALHAVLKRTIPLRVHAHRAFDMETALRVADEFGVRVVLDHGTEAHLLVPEIARRKLDVILGPDLGSRTKLELEAKRPDTAAVLVRAGIKVALMSDHPVSNVQHFHLIPVLAARHGLPLEAALRAVTLDAATILGLGARTGSLSRGKQADVVVWSGPPSDAYSKPVVVLGEGNVVWGELPA